MVEIDRKTSSEELLHIQVESLVFPFTQRRNYLPKNWPIQFRMDESERQPLAKYVRLVVTWFEHPGGAHIMRR